MKTRPMSIRLDEEVFKQFKEKTKQNGIKSYASVLETFMKAYVAGQIEIKPVETFEIKLTQNQ